MHQPPPVFISRQVFFYGLLCTMYAARSTRFGIRNLNQNLFIPQVRDYSIFHLALDGNPNGIFCVMWSGTAFVPVLVL